MVHGQRLQQEQNLILVESAVFSVFLIVGGVVHSSQPRVPVVVIRVLYDVAIS